MQYKAHVILFDPAPPILVYYSGLVKRGFTTDQSRVETIVWTEYFPSAVVCSWIKTGIGPVTATAHKMFCFTIEAACFCFAFLSIFWTIGNVLTNSNLRCA